MTVQSRKVLVLFSLFLILLTACSSNIEEEKESALSVAKSTFMDTAEKPNKKSGNTRFFMPDGYEIKEEEDYNIHLDKNGNLVLVFINPNEDVTSTIHTDSFQKNKEAYIAQQIFTQKDRIGGIAIKEIAEDEYELTVAVGGVKASTQTNTKDITSYAEELMEIAVSIKQ